MFYDAIQPAVEISLSGGGSVQAAFGRDSDTLIVQTSESAINLFSLAIYFWPEFLGVLTFLLIAWALLHWWRVARAPRQVGQPHCRCCGYCLTGIAEDRCPECGIPPSKRRPIIGRSLKRRVGPLVSIACIIALLYGALWTLQAPRVGYVNSLLSIWSPKWYEAARKRNATSLDRIILKCGGPVIRLAEYDVTTGKERRVIRHLRGTPTRNCFHLDAAADEIWTASASERCLYAISVSSGRVLRAFPVPADFHSNARWYGIAGIRSDSKTAIAVIHDSAHDKAVVVSTDRVTGLVTTLMETDTVPAAGSGTNLQTPGDFFLAPCDDHIRLIERRNTATPDSDRSDAWRISTSMTLWEVTEGQSESTDFPASFDRHCAPAFTKDGQFMFGATAFDKAVPVRWDLKTLEPVGYQQETPGRRFSRWINTRTGKPTVRAVESQIDVISSNLAYCPIRNRIYALRYPIREKCTSRIGCYRVDTEQWVEELAYPYNMGLNALAVSSDGTRLLARTTIESTSGSSEPRLLVYDVR